MYTTSNTTKAFYINERRNIIGIEKCDSNGEWEGIDYIAADADDPLYQNILELYTVDSIESEYQAIEIERAAEQEAVIKAMFDEGKIQRHRSISNTENYARFLRFVVDYANHDSEDKEEGLFNLKLAAFELDGIESSNDDAMKEGLRTAPDPLTLFNRIYAAIQS